MKDKSYTNKKGERKEQYKLENNDTFVPTVDEPKHLSPEEFPTLKFDKYLLNIDKDGREVTLELTGGQYKKIMGMKPLKGKKFKAEMYEISGKYYVGIALDGEQAEKPSLSLGGDVLTESEKEFVPRVKELFEEGTEDQIRVALVEKGMTTDRANLIIAEARK